MPSSLRAALVYTVILAMTGLATGVAGFVVAHEPQREVLSVSFRPDGGAERTFSGSVVAIIDGVVTIAGVDGAADIRLDPALPLEELVRLEAEELESLLGRRVNVGAEQAASGLVLTGVVAIGEGGE